MDFLRSLYDPLPLRIFLRAVAALYALGAFVHVRSIAGQSGYAWPSAPLAWRVFDIVFLALNLTAVIGVILRSPVGVLAIALAIALQLTLFLGFPEQFSTTPEQRAALQTLVWLHLGTLAAFTVLVLWKRRVA